MHNRERGRGGGRERGRGGGRERGREGGRGNVCTNMKQKIEYILHEISFSAFFSVSITFSSGFIPFNVFFSSTVNW